MALFAEHGFPLLEVKMSVHRSAQAKADQATFAFGFDGRGSQTRIKVLRFSLPDSARRK